LPGEPPGGNLAGSASEVDAVDEQFRLKLNAKLDAYRSWFASRSVQSCRLVHYCGPDLVGAKTLPLGDVEREIEGLVSEGFYVDWAEHAARLYLRVWEFDGPEPEWAKVFAEVPLADVDELLRQAGFERTSLQTICVSIAARDQWPSDDEMRERDAIIGELEAAGIGKCVGSGGGCGVIEFCFEVGDVERARGALDAILNARFPGRRFSVGVEEPDDPIEVRTDREFFQSLGVEREGVRCRHPGCARGAVSMSVLCRRHHFEQVLARACPFDD
jgi:hypothetical protein